MCACAAVRALCVCATERQIANEYTAELFGKAELSRTTDQIMGTGACPCVCVCVRAFGCANIYVECSVPVCVYVENRAIRKLERTERIGTDGINANS